MITQTSGLQGRSIYVTHAYGIVQKFTEISRLPASFSTLIQISSPHSRSDKMGRHICHDLWLQSGKGSLR